MSARVTLAARVSASRADPLPLVPADFAASADGSTPSGAILCRSSRYEFWVVVAVIVAVAPLTIGIAKLRDWI